MMFRKQQDALHDLLNAVVIGIGAHKPTEYHILNPKKGMVRFVKGKTALPVLELDERFDRLIWVMGGQKPDGSYEPYAAIMLEAEPRVGGVLISCSDDEDFVSPCRIAGVQGQLRRSSRAFDVLTAPTVQRLSYSLCTIVNAAHLHYEDRLRTSMV